MKFAHLNVRSLLPHFASFHELLSKANYDVFGITETWLDPESDVGVVAIPGFSFHHVPRAGRGGGVAIYIRSKFNYKVILREVTEYIEQIWIEITFASKKLFVGLFIVPIQILTSLLTNSKTQWLHSILNLTN